MGRPPCCDKSNVKRGLWTAEEDMKILAHISTHGVGNWTSVPKKAGLKRCGKSCRLRWTNYLRPDLKHDSFTPEEEELIIQLHATIGSRWSMIAAQLPGRTDNDVKNLWNTKLRKKLFEMGIDPVTHKPISQIIADYGSINLPKLGTSKSSISHHHHLTDSLIRSPNRDLIKKAFQIKSESLLSQLHYQDYHNINSMNIPMPTKSLNLNCSSHSWEVLAQLQAMQLAADQQLGSNPSSYSCTNQQDKSMEIAPPVLQYSEAFYNPKMEASSSSPPLASFNWCEFLSDDAFLQYSKQEDGSMFAHNTDRPLSEEANYQNQYGLLEIGQGQASEETSSISARGEASSRSFVDELLDGEKYVQMLWDFPDSLLQDP